MELESWEQTLADLARVRGAALKRHAFLLCGDDAQADDLVQEALVRAFTRPLRVPGPGAAEAYVRVIMANLFIDGARRHSRWRRTIHWRTFGTAATCGAAALTSAVRISVSGK